MFDKGVDKKYFCMDFIRGGDLWRRLDAADGPIPEQEAIFYIAELVRVDLGGAQQNPLR